MNIVSEGHFVTKPPKDSGLHTPTGVVVLKFQHLILKSIEGRGDENCEVKTLKAHKSEYTKPIRSPMRNSADRQPRVMPWELAM